MGSGDETRKHIQHAGAGIPGKPEVWSEKSTHVLKLGQAGLHKSHGSNPVGISVMMFRSNKKSETHTAH